LIMSVEHEGLVVRAERSRNHLSELINSLQDQIAPAELMSQLVGHRGGRDEPGLGAAIAAQVSRNPLACLLIAAGIGLLVYSERAEKPPRRKRTVRRGQSARKHGRRRITGPRERR
jgi:hypothetical protein